MFISDGLAPEQVRALMQPLHSARVSHRDQGGRQLSYLEAYDVKATLTRIFGFGGYSCETLDCQVVHKDLRERANNRPIWDVAVMATVRLTIPVTESVYIETAASMQSNPDFGEALDFAVKTAESDALKRCATHLGTQFGLGLYDNGSNREIVRVLFEPHQKAMLEPAGEDLSPENAARLAASVGRQNDAQAPAQTPPAADAEATA